MSDNGQPNAKARLESIHEMTAKLEEMREAQDGHGEDSARETIQDSALSVLLRSGWYAPGHEGDAEAEEFEILLSTGGPALRIVGTLGMWSAPEEPRLQYQHWGIPWTDYETTAEDDEALLEFVRCFYFGD